MIHASRQDTVIYGLHCYRKIRRRRQNTFNYFFFLLPTSLLIFKRHILRAHTIGREFTRVDFLREYFPSIWISDAAMRNEPRSDDSPFHRRALRSERLKSSAN